MKIEFLQMAERNDKIAENYFKFNAMIILNFHRILETRDKIKSHSNTGKQTCTLFIYVMDENI